MGFSISQYNLNFGLYQLQILNTISNFFITLESNLSNLKSLYLNILETENKEKGEQCSFRLSAVYKSCKFLYKLSYENIIMYLRKRLFQPIFLNNNKVLYPLFVHNDIKYVVLSNSSSMTKTDVFSVKFNTIDATDMNKQNEKVILNVLNIFEMEKLKPDDFNVESIHFDVLNKFYALETISFEKDKPIML